MTRWGKLLDNHMLEINYQHSQYLTDFLLACADDLLCSPETDVMSEIDALRDDDLIALVNWWVHKHNSEKLTVQVFPNDKGFLIYDTSEKRYTTGCLDNLLFNLGKEEFSRAEIKQMQQDSKLAIDWQKAILKPKAQVIQERKNQHAN